MEAKWQRPSLDPPEDPDEDWFLWYDRFLAFPPNAQGKRIVPPDYVMMDGYKLGELPGIAISDLAGKSRSLPSSAVASLLTRCWPFPLPPSIERDG